MKLKTITRHQVTSIFEIEECNRTGYKSLFTTRNYAPGNILSNFDQQEILTKPYSHSIQINDEQHITLQPGYLQYVNHSCSPNVFFDTRHFKLIAIHPIKSGDELTFFYPSTEWQLDEPFDCNCDSPECLERISGAVHLTNDQLMKYRMSDYIVNKYNNLPQIQYQHHSKFISPNLINA